MSRIRPFDARIRTHKIIPKRLLNKGTGPRGLTHLQERPYTLTREALHIYKRGLTHLQESKHIILLNKTNNNSTRNLEFQSKMYLCYFEKAMGHLWWI